MHTPKAKIASRYGPARYGPKPYGTRRHTGGKEAGRAGTKLF
ncbi:MAG: hypothetical protein U0Q07_11815 [Acidimicrobiales bacterium]